MLTGTRPLFNALRSDRLTEAGPTPLVGWLDLVWQERRRSPPACEPRWRSSLRAITVCLPATTWNGLFTYPRTTTATFDFFVFAHLTRSTLPRAGRDDPVSTCDVVTTDCGRKTGATDRWESGIAAITQWPSDAVGTSVTSRPLWRSMIESKTGQEPTFCHWGTGRSCRRRLRLRPLCQPGMLCNQVRSTTRLRYGGLGTESSLPSPSRSRRRQSWNYRPAPDPDIWAWQLWQLCVSGH